MINMQTIFSAKHDVSNELFSSRPMYHESYLVVLSLAVSLLYKSFVSSHLSLVMHHQRCASNSLCKHQSSMHPFAQKKK